MSDLHIKIRCGSFTRTGRGKSLSHSLAGGCQRDSGDFHNLRIGSEEPGSLGGR